MVKFCPMYCGAVGVRFLRAKSVPWVTMAIAPLRVFATSGVERTRAQIRYFISISKIDFVAVYATLNDLLW